MKLLDRFKRARRDPLAFFGERNSWMLESAEDWIWLVLIMATCWIAFLWIL